MKTPYLDPLIPLHETSEETLTRLSANIGTLTGLIDEAERVGHYSVVTMFNRARDAKVAQARAVIARVTASGDEPADDRRFHLVRDPVPVGDVPRLRPRRPARSPVQLTLAP